MKVYFEDTTGKCFGNLTTNRDEFNIPRVGETVILRGATKSVKGEVVNVIHTFTDGKAPQAVTLSLTSVQSY